MNRRTYLTSVGAASLSLLAGCTSNDDSSGGSGGGNDSSSDNGSGSQTVVKQGGNQQSTTPQSGQTTQMQTGTVTGTRETTGQGTPDQTSGGTQSAKTAPNTIKMETQGSDYYFDPVGLYVEPGETITWKIVTPPHTSTAYKKGNGPATVTRIPEGAKAWDSGVLSKDGATFQYTFTTKGTYDYFCTPHKSLGMVARIVVGEPGGPAEGSMPPDGTVPTSKEIMNKRTIPWRPEYGQ